MNLSAALTVFGWQKFSPHSSDPASEGNYLVGRPRVNSIGTVCSFENWVTRQHGVISQKTTVWSFVLLRKFVVDVRAGPDGSAAEPPQILCVCMSVLKRNCGILKHSRLFLLKARSSHFYRFVQVFTCQFEFPWNRLISGCMLELGKW